MCCKILFGCHSFVSTLCFFKAFCWVRWKACLNCLTQLWIYFITMLTFVSVGLTEKTKYTAKPWTLSLVQYHQYPHYLIFLPRNWYALPKMKHYRSVGSEALVLMPNALWHAPFLSWDLSQVNFICASGYMFSLLASAWCPGRLTSTYFTKEIFCASVKTGE